MLYCKETSGYHIDPPHSCVSYADLLLLGTELSLFPFLILSNRWTDYWFNTYGYNFDDVSKNGYSRSS